MRLRTEVEGRHGRDRARPSWCGLHSVALTVLTAAALTAPACGASSSTGHPEQGTSAAAPTILATTGIWRDIVSSVACGGLADVDTIVPSGSDPHGYEPSLQDRARMESAALVVANGLELEKGLEDTLEAVSESGTPVFEFADGMHTIPFSFEGAQHGGEEGHDDEEDEGHGSGGDPHVWFDPHRVSEALPELARLLTRDVGLDADAIGACLASYLAELEAVDAEIAAKVEQLPAGSRKLVTSHEALGYFADRYGFEVVGTVIPTPASMAQTNPAQLEELAEIIEHEGIKAIFAETLHSVDDVGALADRVGDIEVVTLYTGSLGPSGSGAETYVGLLRTNADLIVDALG